VLSLIVLLLLPASAGAQSAPTVTDGEITNEFPNGVTFRLSAESDSPIETIRLRYKILPDGFAAIGRLQFEPARSVEFSYSIDIYLPPGTIIEYYWQVTDADGDESRTDTASYFYDDVRFDWTPLEEAGVTVYHYSASENQARAMLNTAKQTLSSMSELLGATIDFPVKVWLYDSAEDMRPALQRRSETYESRTRTLGVRVASDTVVVLGTTDLDTLRHELTHVVTAVAGESAFGTLPAWLNEGTAMYGQESVGDFEDAVNNAIRRGNVFTVRQITSYQGDPDAVGLFYGESWSLVKFLNDEYGPEKFAALFAEIKSGKRIDRALEAAYGFDQDGLDAEWRESHGLPPRETPEPTAPPQDEPLDTGAPSANGRTQDGGGTSVGVIIGVIVGFLALAGAIGFAGVALSRKVR